MRLQSIDPRGWWLASARTMFAVATLSVIAVNPDDVLFLRAGDGPALRCDGVRGLSLWCLGQSNLGAARIASIVVLTAVLAGLSPRWTCIPHWYVTFSLCVSMTLPNGASMWHRSRPCC